MSPRVLRAFARLLSGEVAATALERMERLQSLSAALAGAATPSDVAQVIFAQGFHLVGARAVTLHWERAAGELELVHAFGVSEAFAARWRRLSAREAHPGAEAYRTGEPLWLGSPSDLAARFPEFSASAVAEGDQACGAIPLVAGHSRGALGLLYDAPRPFDAQDRKMLVAVSSQCAQALERARLHDAQAQLAARLGALQAATAALSGALTPAEVAAVAFRGLVGLGLANGFIYYRTVPDRLDLLFAHGEDDATRRELAHLSIDAPGPASDAARTGEVVWLETPAAIRERYPALEPLRARRGDGAWVGLPLSIEGRAVGALNFTLPEGRRLDPLDRTFALALAQQCAQALERSRLFETEKRLAERLAQMQSTTAALSGAATPREVAEHTFRALAALGASAVELHAVAGPEHIVLVAQHGVAITHASTRLDAPDPAAEVVRSGRALWLESPQEIDERFPHLEPERSARGDGAWAVVPLLAAGRSLGALAVSFPRARRFDQDEKAFVRMISQPCAQALERARFVEMIEAERADAERHAALLDEALASAPEPLALLGMDLRVVSLNRGMAERLGVSGEGAAGHTPEQLIPGVLGEQLAAEARRAAASTGQAAFTVDLVGETPADPGTTRRFAATFYPVRVGGALAGVGIALQDGPRTGDPGPDRVDR